jgi:cytochrome P450
MEINDLYSNGIHVLPLDKFEYLDKFVGETIRLFPIKMVSRVVTNSFEFDGHVFLVGTLVDINLKALHRHPLFWDSPGKVHSRKIFHTKP